MEPIYRYSANRKCLLILSGLMLVQFIVSEIQGQSVLRVVNLRTEYKTNPLGIDVINPRLSWEIVSDERNVLQTAYRIRTALSSGGLTTGESVLWDTGKKLSDQSVHVLYSGPALKSGQRIWWQVKVWDGIRPDGSFQSAGMNSFNHYAYGAVGNWLYTKVAGISVDPEFPGYKHFTIKPYLTDKLSYAQAEYHSVYGEIKSRWERENDKLKLHIAIPANTTAIIELPAKGIRDITEGRIPISELSEIIVKGITDNRVILYLGSGTYDFEAKLN